MVWAVARGERARGVLGSRLWTAAGRARTCSVLVRGWAAARRARTRGVLGRGAGAAAYRRAWVAPWARDSRRRPR